MKIIYKETHKKEHTFLFACDLHYGNKRCAMNDFMNDLKEAKKRNARTILVGDMFDAVFPYGDRRFNPSTMIPELSSRDDAPIHATQLLAKRLYKYAELIDVILIGNHEVAVLKYNGINMTELLVMQLNQYLKESGKEHRVINGGYQCYIGYSMADGTDGTGRKTFSILAFHGGGGSAPVTKGMIDINRKSLNWTYDVLVFGHKHNAFSVRDVNMYPIYSKNGGVCMASDVRAIQAGAYYRNYSFDALDSSALPGFEEVGNHAPKPIGGTFLTVSLTSQRFDKKRCFKSFRMRAEV